MKQDCKLAVRVGYQTCVGCSGPFPRDSGNCFSLETESDGSYSIANFVVENLEHAIAKGWLTWPVKIRPLDDKVAVIHDERIPHRWYKQNWCRICCPVALLPIQQQLEIEREKITGATETRDGITIRRFGLNPQWPPKE